jgi:tetratricopeptide (TPR) repeat protein
MRPSWKEGWWALGSVYYTNDNFTGCRDAYQRLTSLEPKGGPAWTMLGLCEIGLKEYPPALEALERGRDLGGGTREINDVARLHLAKLYIKSEQFEKALGIVASMIETGSTDPRLGPLGGLGVLRRAQFPEEVPAADRELVYLAGRAFWSAASKPVADTQREIDLLLSKYPDAPGVHYFYGTFLLTGDTDHAMAEFRKELITNPNHVPALAAIASEYLKRNDAEKGLPYAKKAVELGPEAPGTHALLGRLLLLRGDTEQSAKELEAARRLAPDDPQIRFTLASVYTKLGRADEAARERQEFVRLQGSGANAAVKQGR